MELNNSLECQRGLTAFRRLSRFVLVFNSNLVTTNCKLIIPYTCNSLSSSICRWHACIVACGTSQRVNAWCWVEGFYDGWDPRHPREACRFCWTQILLARECWRCPLWSTRHQQGGNRELGAWVPLWEKLVAWFRACCELWIMTAWRWMRIKCSRQFVILCFYVSIAVDLLFGCLVYLVRTQK